MRFLLLIGVLLPSLVRAQWLVDKDLTAIIAAAEGHGHAGMHKDDGPPRPFDVVYNRLELDLDPAVRAIHGTVTHYFRTTAEMQQLVFDLSTALTVEQAVYHGGAVPFTHADERLSIDLPTLLPTDQLDSIAITYGGEPPNTGFGSFVQQDHAGAPALWTLSEPYGARDWWPCKQDLRDKADSLDVIVTTVPGQRVAGNGLLIAEETLGNGDLRFHWRHRYPIAHYLVAVAVTNYVVFTNTAELQDGEVELLHYVYPEDLELAQIDLVKAAQHMEVFDALFGPYPFAAEKYGHAQFGWGGGMEHQTMSFMGSFHFEIVSHEAGHQWFGDKVTCGSWEDLWLNEGFATYMTALCYEALEPASFVPFQRARRNLVISEPGGSVLVTDTNDVARLFDSRLTYMKGSYLLHMLRWKCGDEDFFAACRNYLNDPALAYGSARTPDLQAHLEATSGMDLDEFFADWYVGEGYPIYTVEWTQDAGGQVSLTLDQGTSHPSVDFYEMPVPIRFSDGVNVHDVRLEHTSNGQEFTFSLPFQADQAELDPDAWLLHGQSIVLHVPVEAYGNDRFVLFPNPAGDEAWIHTGISIQGPVTLTIHDPAGRLVHTSQPTVTNGRVAMQLPGLSAGMYAAELRTADHTTVFRFMKE